ncbi:trimeric intracellular cation channel family protein [Wenyingzhuangia sp. chi5]|uniref:Trimeric intracellular cation channel family protein n=1 Tax=Wenyingzhuangia gilva TaxID=3057677 RepID=A0ABT8VPM1_9FLAO|nr:trimeric intracellular cation channel family protein [Wenyingzhuangia sp. chi5]MDO3693924.1 trimeric intracellular cation channel family protein [Wenyingzhuangia sp. chi5]
MDTIIEYINISGSFVFAVSGALIAMKKRLDPFGVLIVAFITAVGGGTLRDILIDRQVFWLYNNSIIYSVLIGATVAMIFKSKMNFFTKPIFFYDALGLGLFSITGVQIGLEADLSSSICILLGTVTGVFGGVLRDVVVNRIPVVFKKEIYATASILGGFLYLVLLKLNVPNPYSQIVPILFIIMIRLTAVFFNISLPSIYKRQI